MGRITGQSFDSEESKIETLMARKQHIDELKQLEL
jgi:hypothetical protein